jgi:hypothetical protein
MTERRINPDEAIARSYLEHLGYQDILHEPDGNVPPDFLINGCIAVEVRRLNENHEGLSRTEGLEEERISLTAKMKQLMRGIGDLGIGESWFVMYEFSRPVATWRDLRGTLEARLQDFGNSPQREATKWEICKSFRMSVMKASRVHENTFVVGGSVDEDSGGWMADLMTTNLRICIQEKTRKVAVRRTRYLEWWLLLVDNVGIGLMDESDWRAIHEASISKGGFGRVVVVDPSNLGRSVTI